MNRFVLPLVVVLVAAAQSFAQESTALLHAPRVVLPVDGAPFQKLGDFDGDGDLDAVGTRHHELGSLGEVVVWRNDGGAFTQVFSSSAGQGLLWANGPRTLPVEVVDLNGDGLDDFVVATRGRATRFIAQHGMQFTPHIWWLPNASSYGARAIASGDFDADGLADVAVATPDGQWSRLYVFFGSGAWTSAPTVAIANTAPVRLAALELDAHPGDELLLFQHNSAAANAYLVAAGQIVHLRQFASLLNPANPKPWLWTGGDVDGDGDTDLVVFKPASASSSAAEYEVFRRTGPGTFVQESIVVGGPAEYLADVDGDGDLDGVCCGGSGGGSNYNWPKLDFASQFEIAINEGGGSFAPAFSFPGAGSESLAGVADLDADGDQDLVAGRCVFYGDGPWTEQPMPRASGLLGWYVPRRLNLHDIDGDGDPDYRGVRNDGDGFFVANLAEPSPSPGSNYSGNGIPCDVDGDGVRDRIRIQSGQVTGMIWQRNNGGGHFEHMGLVGPAGVILGSVAVISEDTWFVADFDGDGDEDLYVQGTGELFWNQSGSFGATPEMLPVIGWLQGVGDLNGDGLVDIAMHAGSQQHVLFGTGTAGGSFVSAWSHTFLATVPFEPEASLVSDLNRDGKLDILMPYTDGKLRLFVNGTQPSGLAVFTMHTLVGPSLVLSNTGSSVSERLVVTAADFDGDGAIDIGCSDLVGQHSTYAVMRRLTTDPSVHTYESVLFVIRDGHAADADGDGDPDLIGDRVTRSRRFDRFGGARRMQRHDALPGENGAKPVLGGTGPYIAGAAHTLSLTGVPGPTVAVLGLSLGEVYLADNPLPGLTLYLDPAWMLIGAMPITQNGEGRAAASATVSLPIFPGTEGWTFHLQAFVPDAAAPSLYTFSNLLSLRIGS